MLKKIRIKNFQAISESTLTLGGFTVVVGDNDVGKSATLRALAGSLFNDGHKSSVRQGSSNCEVVLILDQGKVKWVRGNTNTYLLKKGAGPSQEFTKIGTHVPSEISRFLNMEEVTLAGDSVRLQYQPQFEGPIIVSRSSGILAGLLDEVIGVGILNRAAGLVRKDMAGDQSKSRFLTERFEQLKTEVAAEDTLLNDLRKVYEVCQEWFSYQVVLEIRGIEKECVSLTEKITKLEAQKIQIQKFKKVAEICIIHRELKVHELIMGRLVGLVEVAKNGLKAIREVSGELHEICGMYTARQEVMELRARIVSVEKSGTEVTDKLKIVEERKQTILTKLKICPTCGTVLAEV